MPVFDVSALEAIMPEPEEVRTAAKSLLNSATAIQSITENAAQSWGKLQAPDVYVIDGAEVVFSAFRPIQRASRDFADDFGTLDAAANVFADAVVDLKARLADVKARAAALNQKAAGDDEWTKDQDLVAEQDSITNELNTISADLRAHERTFAQSISDMYNGHEYVEYSENGPAEGQFEHGIPRDVLNAAAAEGHVPWAHPRAFDKPWYRDAGDAYWAYTKAFYGAGADTVLGLAGLVGLRGGDTFVQSWTGVGTLAHDLFIVTGAGLPFMMATGQEQKVKDSAGNLLDIAKETIHLDEWKTDPASALGATAFDVVTAVGTGGVGAAVKGTSVAGKAGSMVDDAGDAGKVGKGGGAPSKGRMADLVESTLARGADAAHEIKVKIDDIKKTVIEHAHGAADKAHDAAKNTLGRLGIGPGQHLVDADGATPSKADSDTRSTGNKSTDEFGVGALPDDNEHAGSGPSTPEDVGPKAGEADGGEKDPKKWDDRPGLTANDASGQLTEVLFPNGTKIPVNYPIQTPRGDLIEELRPTLESIGKDEAWLRGTIAKDVDQLSTEDLQSLLELRHAVPPLSPDTLMQKVIDSDTLDSLVNGTNTYGHTAGGFISRASDVADLRTPEDVYNALRLDYQDTPYLPNNDKPVYAVQFRAGDDLEDIRIPDARAQDALRKEGFDAADSTGRPYPEPHPDLNYDPNKGHGWTGSKVEHSKLIPEYQVQKGTGVPYEHGDVIWEINKSGKRVLAAIFDKYMIRPDGESGMWRRVTGPGG